MIKTLRWVWRAYRRWEAERLLRRSVMLNPEPFQAYILEQSTTATMLAVKGHLRRRGVFMCEVCTSTKGPLRKVGGVAACPAHLAQVRQQEAEKQRLALLPDQAAA